MSNYLTSRLGLSSPPTRPCRKGGLLVACLFGLFLAGAPAAHATPYGAIGHFNTSLFALPFGVAVDNSTDLSAGDVYVANASGGQGADKFDATGDILEPPSPFDTGSERRLTGTAVDPVNGDVYVVNRTTGEIETFNSSGVEVASPISVLPADSTTGFVQIASDSVGNIYIPKPEDNEIKEFEPDGTEAAAFTGTTVGAFNDPRAVAVDSEGNIYVADIGNGRVVRIEHGTGTESEFSTGVGVQSVAVDPSTNDVFVEYLNEEDKCEPLLEMSCVHIVEYSALGARLEDFGAGTIGHSPAVSFGERDQLAVSAVTHDVYVSEVTNPGNVVIFGQAVLPTVTTEAATGETASEATLHGKINPKGAETFCHFEYGTSTTYEHSVPCQPELVGEGVKEKAESVTISGLEGNTEYDYRLVARTGSGQTVRGENKTFATSQEPPVLLASSVFASEVTQSDVVFNATVNPQHLDTHYYFNYGLLPFEDTSTCAPANTVPYASAPATPVDMGEGTGPEAVSLDLGSASVVLYPGMDSRALQPNTVYHFQVVAENAAGASCEPETTFITLPPDPLASTGVASGITQTAANVSGSVTPDSTGPNSDTTWRFQYGTSTSYTGSAPTTAGDAGMGTNAVAVSTALEGLAPNTTYHYRLVASNANADPAANAATAPQIANGADHTFTTPPSEPLLDQPSSLTETAVTLNGAVNPSGHRLHYSFQYGSTTAYGQSSPTEDAGEGATLTPASASLAGITPGVTYHYRLVAIGAGGESYSPDSTFTLYPPVSAQTGNPFSVGQSTAAPFPAIPLLSAPAFPPPPTETRPPSPKPLTNAQKLSKALKACKLDKSKSKRTKCEKEARKKYGKTTKKKK
ncbi:MAG: NHL repeat-containing protein [Solirubrobacteraceae bacterium]